MRSVGRPAAAGDHRVEQTAGTAGAVGEFGGERGVAAGDFSVAQHRRQGEVGVGVPFGHRTQHVERGATGRIERLAAAPDAGRCGAWSFGARGFVEPGPAGPVRRRSSVLARAVEPRRAVRAAIRCRPALVPLDPNRPGARVSADCRRRRTGPTLIRSSPIMVHAPGFGVTARIRRSTAWAGRSQRTRASSTVILGATVTPSAGCGTGVQRPVGDAVQGRLQQRRTRYRQPFKQFPGGVGRADGFGHHAVDRSGVEFAFDPEGRGPRDRVARGDRRLYRRRAAPRRQQREMQVHPAVLGTASSRSLSSAP